MKNKILFTLTFVLSFSFAFSFAQTASMSSSTVQVPKFKNAGYKNLYLMMYRQGRISTFPPFGGPITTYVPCWNDGVRWARVGAPRGGDYIWTPQTQTYEFGPPSHEGQFLLGLFAPEYFCIVNPNPLVVFEGLIITMMGSSQ